MCGLIGLCARRDPGSDRFDVARDVMALRGPDGASSAVLETRSGHVLRLGHRRLSIQDLSNAGTQPMTSSCGRYLMVYNGEVYNAPALRRDLEAAGRRFQSTSDTEVILEGYACWGAAVVGRLHGMFAFAIWDKVEERIFAARDRVGIKPFYLSVSPDSIAFASDARALRALGLGREIDPEAMALYLCLGYVPAPRSIWKGLTKLEAGFTLSWSAAEGVTLARYWSAPDDTDYEAGTTPLDGLIDEIVEEQLLSDVPIGLFLSGGIDSSVIASSLVRAAGAGEAVTALTVAFPGNATADESPIAAKTATQLGLNSVKLALAANTGAYYDAAVAALDEPLGYSAIVTQAAISRLAKEAGLKVVLSGDGGDEVFGGYRWYARTLDEFRAALADGGASHGGWASILPHVRRRQAAAAQTAQFLAIDPLFVHATSVFRGLLPAQVARIYPAVAEDDLVALLREGLSRHDAPRLPEKRRRQRIDLFTFCQDVVLPKVDRTGMAYGVEARPPLLDHRLVEWALSRPISAADDAAPKNALRGILRDRGLGFLLDQPKRGFSLQSKGRLSRNRMRAAISRHATDLGLSPTWSLHLRSLRGDRLELDTLHFLVKWHEAVAAPSAAI